eukprot:superscaffoldBa00000197_g2624
MAGKLTTAQGTGILLVTANVGSLFEDPENLQKTWLREFYQTVQSHKPHFLAVHCQEVGGKNYEASMSHVDSFVKELLSSDAMKEYSRARVYLDENYKSQEHFTRKVAVMGKSLTDTSPLRLSPEPVFYSPVKALGSFYFIHESLKNIHQFDFKAKKFRKVVGKETCSETLESTPSLEKEKFPQDYFPEDKQRKPPNKPGTAQCERDEGSDVERKEPLFITVRGGDAIADLWKCKWSRKGFIRTRWALADCAFDLVNIHLFHDASNLVAWENSPSVYSGTRQKALGYVLDRITDQRYERVPYFVFGDFNFRLDSKQVIESLCSTATMQTVRTADTNEVDKLIFRESDNDRKVVLQLEKKLFNYVNQDVFRENNGTSDITVLGEESLCGTLRLARVALKEQIGLVLHYPYSEDSNQGKEYMNTRCPAWCDRILMSSTARDLVLKVSFIQTNAFYPIQKLLKSRFPTYRFGFVSLQPENEEKSIVYDNIGPNVCMGDHKPVFLSFRITAGAGKCCQRGEKIFREAPL